MAHFRYFSHSNNDRKNTPGFPRVHTFYHLKMKLSVPTLSEEFTRERITEDQQNVTWETTNKSSCEMFFPCLNVGCYLTFLAFHIFILDFASLPFGDVRHTGSEALVTEP